MKPVLSIVALILFATNSFASPLKRIMPDRTIPKSVAETFECVLKLDSLNYHSGKLQAKIRLTNRFNHIKQEKLHAKYRQLSDSLYSVKIKSHSYILNTKTGRVVDSKTGYLVYQNVRLNILKLLENEQRTSVSGTDSLGTFTAYFDDFPRDVPSYKVYEPRELSPGKTIQYKIRQTSYADAFTDSSWIDHDTTRIIKQYNQDRLIFERIERRSAYDFPEIAEYQYSLSGDTTIRVLTHFEDGYGGDYPSGIYMTTSPGFVVKTVHILNKNKSHTYEYVESKTQFETTVTDKSWKFMKRGGFFSTETTRQVIHKEHFGPFRVITNTKIRFSSKK